MFEKEANLVNHLKVCTGEECEADMKKCGGCGKWLKKKSMPKHKRIGQDSAGEEAHTMPFARKQVPKSTPCPSCGRVLSLTNMVRHLKIC